MQGADTTNDLSLYREAYQKQADIIIAKILHQLCLPQVTGTESVENQREKASGEEEMGERELISGFNLCSKDGVLPSVIRVPGRSFLPWPEESVYVFSTGWKSLTLTPTGRLEMCKLFNLISKVTNLIREIVGEGLCLAQQMAL